MPADPEMPPDRMHTLNEYYDGPRRGTADYCGSPHHFAAVWNYSLNEYDPDLYILSPISSETLQLVLEAWAIWCRLEAARVSGRISQAEYMQCHPALPEDRERSEELKQLLAPRLMPDLDRCFLATGEFFDFRPAVPGSPGTGIGLVRWTPRGRSFQ